MSALTLDIEKAAAGGRMLARHEGRIVLVSGAIPGERVSVRVEKTERGVVFADVVDLVQVSEDRRPVKSDARCGGNVFAHIAYARQLGLKGEIIQDAFRRIGRLPLPVAPVVSGSPEQGYRMRARLHVRGGRIGFYREGTHEVCDVATTGQLRPETSEWVGAAQRTLERTRLREITAIEIAENIPGDQRACHVELLPNAVAADYAAISEGLVGLSAQRADRPGVVRVAGTPVVTDCIQVRRRSRQHAHAQPGRKSVLPRQPVSRRDARPARGRTRAARTCRRSVRRRWTVRALACRCREGVCYSGRRRRRRRRGPVAQRGTVRPPRHGHPPERRGLPRGGTGPRRRACDGHRRSSAYRRRQRGNGSPHPVAAWWHCLRFMRRCHAGARHACPARWRLRASPPQRHRPLPEHGARGNDRNLRTANEP